MNYNTRIDKDKVCYNKVHMTQAYVIHVMQIPLPILIVELFSWSSFSLLGIFGPTSIIDIILILGLSRKFSKNGLQLFLLMLSTTFNFNGLSNTNLVFFCFAILGYDLFCKTLDEAVRPVLTPVRLVFSQLASLSCLVTPRAQKYWIQSLCSFLGVLGRQIRLETAEFDLDQQQQAQFRKDHWSAFQQPTFK